MFDRPGPAIRRIVVRSSVLTLVFLSAALSADGFSPEGAGEGPVSRQDWLQFNFDAQHSGNNTRETQLSVGNVSSLKLLFQITLPAVADGAPAYLGRVETGRGVRDVLYLTTKPGHIVAVDARSGDRIWQHQHPAGPCRINNGSQPCYTTSSPAVDPNRRFVYTYGLDGYVHKHRAGDGVEIKQGGWPEPATRKPFNEKGSSALGMATAKDGTTYLYVANGGYLGDRGDYQGHVTTINLRDGSQNVFNANCSDQTSHFVEKPGTPDCPAVQSAVWARAGVVYDSQTDRIYFATGNGPFDPKRHDWGDSILALSPDGQGSGGDPLDSFTPDDYQELQDRDLDLGSTAPAVLPVPDDSKVRHLALQAGKSREMYLVNLAKLSGKNGPGHVGGEIGRPIDVPQGGMVFTMPAVWTDPTDGKTWVFIATWQGISALTVEIDPDGTPSLKLRWKNPEGGSSPVVANSVLYYAGRGTIRALDPHNGKQLWHSSRIGGIHWESPIVVNGTVYITDQNARLTAFGLNPADRK